MAGGKLRNVLDRVGRLVASRQAQDQTDQELLARFLQSGEEAAFTALMERHGAMVLGVCGRVLYNAHDAEDACQAVFLVLARKAGSILKRGSLSSWLHGVAWRVSRNLRARLARQHARETALLSEQPAATEPADPTWRELLHILDEELNRLPEVYKTPLMLCHLEGRTQDEAARELGWTLGILRGRLQRGRDKLRTRLRRRGITASAALGVATLAPSLCSAAVPSSLVVSTLNASSALIAGQTVTLSPTVDALIQEALRPRLPLGRLALAIGCAAAALGIVTVLTVGLTGQPAPAPDKKAERWSPAQPLEGHPGARTWCVAFSPDGTRLASGAGGVLPNEGELRIWDLTTGKLLSSNKTALSVRGVAFAPDGKTLATAEHDHIARLRDSESGKVLVQYVGHASGIDTVSFSPDGKTLATSSWDATVKLWDTASGQNLRTLSGQRGQVFAVAFGGSEGTLASGGADGMARIWEASTGNLLHTLKDHRSVVHWLAYAPDGKTLATASWDRTVKLWETETGKLLATLRGHRDPVLALAFAHDGQTLASCASKWGPGTSPDGPSPGEVIIWDLKTQKPRTRLRDFAERLFGVAFSPDDRLLAVAGWDGSVTLWKRESGAPEQAPEIELPAYPELKLSLKDPRDRDSVEFLGPAARRCVRFQPEGLRIVLPTGYPGERPSTGIRIPVSARDFEATVRFEILSEPTPAETGDRTRLKILARLDRPPWTVAALTRRVVRDQGSQFTCWMIRENHENSGTSQSHHREFATTAKSGAFRLVRSGSEVYFYVAEGPSADFKLVHQGPFGTEELESIELSATTGGPKAALDVRFTDLQVRTQIPAVLAEGPSPGSATLYLLGLALLLSVAAAGVWLWKRRRASAPPAPGDSLPPEGPADATATCRCGECGKELRVRAELAGKRLKCPACGKPVRAPDAEPTSTAIKDAGLSSPGRGGRQ
jgi:RNA polymerase sigma factor (sigma-70 family)